MPQVAIRQGLYSDYFSHSDTQHLNMRDKLQVHRAVNSWKTGFCAIPRWGTTELNFTTVTAKKDVKW